MSENPYLLTLPQLISAKKKIGKLAAFYDPEKCSFRGFDAAALTPTEFREQLRRNFLIRLTDAELGAIVLLFDKDGDREIDSTEFINEFFRLGKQEKKKFFLQQKDDTLQKQERKARRVAEHEARFTKLVESHFPDKWTEAEERSAIAKISKVAFSYDADVARWLGGGLQGFMDCGAMNPAQFREQLRRNFELNLSPGEISALMSVFDIDGNGEVDCSEFLYTFFRMGRNEKDRHLRRQMKRTAKLNEEERIRVIKKDEKFAQYAVAKLVPATEKDKKSAWKKIDKAATQHWGDIGGGKSFEAADLTPAAFKEQLKRQFLISLSPGELDAMVKIFDTNGDGGISSVEFLTTFFRIGTEGKRKLHRQKLARMARIEEKERIRRKNKVDKQAALVVTKVDWPELPSEDGEDGSMSSSTSFLPMSPINRASTAPVKKSRKPSMQEYLKTTKANLDPNASVADLFPKATESTKDFIRHIEEQEAAIMSRTRAKTPASPGSRRLGNAGGRDDSYSSAGDYTPIKVTTLNTGDGFDDMDGVLPPLT